MVMTDLRLVTREDEKGRIFRVKDRVVRIEELYRYDYIPIGGTTFVVGRVLQNRSDKYPFPAGMIVIENISNIEFECTACDGTGFTLDKREICSDCNGRCFNNW